MHQILFRLRLRPRPTAGLAVLLRPPCWILWGQLLRGRGKERERNELGIAPVLTSQIRHIYALPINRIKTYANAAWLLREISVEKTRRWYQMRENQVQTGSSNRTRLIRQNVPMSSGVTRNSGATANNLSKYWQVESSLPSYGPGPSHPFHYFRQHLMWRPTWMADQPGCQAASPPPGGNMWPCQFLCLNFFRR